MKKIKYLGISFLILASITTIALSGYKIVKWKDRLKDWGKLEYYTSMNNELVKKTDTTSFRVVFMGNSIMERWSWEDPSYFSSNNYICRGISGQTTEQMLIRFRQDVVNLNPQLVIIEGGINDISEFNGTYNEDQTLNNLKSMCDIAKINQIKIVLTSVPYTQTFEWNKKLGNVSKRTKSLNSGIKEYAEKNGIGFIDIFMPVSTPDSTMNKEYVPDEVHPNAKGYNKIKPIVEKAIKIQKDNLS